MNRVGVLQSERPEYWLKKWEDGQTNWHEDSFDLALNAHVSHLKINGTLSVFVPMCGKSVDMLFLSNQGFSVVGCDISDIAATQFFAENSLTYQKTSNEKATIYHNPEKRLKIVVGDIFDCTANTLESELFDGIWDCNALIAVNPEDRVKYVELLCSLLKPSGNILLSTLDYDQSFRNGFPHTMPISLVRRLFEPHMMVKVLENRTNADKLLSRFMTTFKVPEASRLIFCIQKKEN